MNEAAAGDETAILEAMEGGRLAEAKFLLDKRLEAAPEDPMSLFLFAMLAYLAGNRTVSERMMEVAGERHSLNDEILNQAIGKVFADRPETQREAFYELFAKSWKTTPHTTSENYRKTQIKDGAFSEPWHFVREEVNWLPRTASREDEYIDRFFVSGLAPKDPIFDAGSTVMAMGSCFARYMRNYLIRRRMSSDWLYVPEDLNNSFAIRHFLEWCARGDASQSAYWYGEDISVGGSRQWTPVGGFELYREGFRRCDCVIMTLGLAEVWRDVETRGVFWRGVPQSIFDAKRHRVEMSTVAENVENIKGAIQALREIRPDMHVVLTISPVPLNATFQPKPCMVADCVSKSTLRLAVEEVISKADDGRTWYWPSFEIVRWLGGHLSESPFLPSEEVKDIRHVRPDFVAMIIASFMRHYFKN